MPRVRAAAVIPFDDGVVVVRHAKGDTEYHLLPGGGVEWSETVEETLRREVREETGLDCRIIRPLFISDAIDPDRNRHVVNLTFLAEALGGRIAVSSDDPRVVGVEIVSPRGLAALDLRPPISGPIADAAASGWTAPALYLGALWIRKGDGA